MKVTTNYTCDFCGKDFNNECDCEKHEQMHKKEAEFKRIVTPKFEIGDLVRHNCCIEKIISKAPAFVNDEFIWSYTIGYDPYFHSIKENENNLQLVMKASDVKRIIEKVSTELSAYEMTFDDFLDILEK